MTNEKFSPKESEDPTLEKEATEEVMERYEQASDSQPEETLDTATEKELGEVERALEDETIAIEDGA
ncbi:MAG: hypothetical protein BRC40_07620 [Cyanobacteria bacterium QH_8_48_120]|jgi:hypothetical protein|nr:MAG: hypothetical protein BRC34_08190 [Cyanobacteria bacterium QH_1_48_107]PSO57035.1 MAG: hypothetical protein BRC35_08040 [Cyanobacteria bacterium QH_10_48_56]PSO64068.1 MAG: hypothetical protein BRC39_03320 [Cyanobacteria bacterium QH_7_48_89]PSO64619.1 MAG: hypothetical protein BRC36_06150 [Cyanobacteria bacterium QH_2_48_84]PSO65934.1 MAG: hypothetical protein BRC38_07250 [Cyanobacteria bacterium QH_6_48_35]PSO68619.1 MAG: hypothetical protein BRC42_13215 [Cyanobacteria bacterium QS_1_